MPPRTDFLSRQRKQIVARLEELRPLYEEYLTLEKAQQALDQVGGPIRRAASSGRRNGRRTTRRGPGRPPGRQTGRRPATRRTSARSTARSTTRSSARRRQGRPAAARRGRGGSGSTRADEALSVIRANPGISIPDLAKKLRIRPNYLYRVTAALQKEGRVRRRNRGFHAA